MGYKGPKATNIYQNPGIKNNPGVITDPYIKGVGSPAKSHTAAHTLEQKKEADKDSLLITGFNPKGNIKIAKKDLPGYNKSNKLDNKSLKELLKENPPIGWPQNKK